MGCNSPIHGYRKKEAEASGKYKITINPAQGNTAYPMTVPCGRCTGCRLERSRQWAIRCVHESRMHKHNAFITLTYDNDHLPKNKSLVKKHFQDFMKRLRKKHGKGIRYYHCGEYGEQNLRPHYHACLFGFDFKDKKPWRNNLYRSPSLEQLWPMGFSTIGEVNFETAAYVARYILKKQFGSRAMEHYNTIDKTTGEITNERTPEYTTMSRRPGIGAPFFDAYSSQICRTGEVMMRGRKMRTPRFYDKKIEAQSPQDYRRIKNKRLKQAIKQKLDNTIERLEVKEKCAKLNQRERRKL